MKAMRWSVRIGKEARDMTSKEKKKPPYVDKGARKPVSMEVVLVEKVVYIVNDNELMPNRKVVEYWYNGELVGRQDPLDDFDSII